MLDFTTFSSKILFTNDVSQSNKIVTHLPK